MKNFLSASILLLASNCALSTTLNEKSTWGLFANHSTTLQELGISFTSRQDWAGWSFHNMTIPSTSEDLNANIFSLNLRALEYSKWDVTGRLYLHIGGGHSEFTEVARGVGYAAGTLEFAHRAFLVSAHHSQLYHGGADDYQRTSVRGGVVPGFGKWSGEIHFQFLVEWEKEKVFTADFSETFTPMLQINYKTVSLEVGQSWNGSTAINYSMQL